MPLSNIHMAVINIVGCKEEEDDTEDATDPVDVLPQYKPQKRMKYSSNVVDLTNEPSTSSGISRQHGITPTWNRSSLFSNSNTSVPAVPSIPSAAAAGKGKFMFFSYFTYNFFIFSSFFFHIICS